jgi:hypothetical protein
MLSMWRSAIDILSSPALLKALRYAYEVPVLQLRSLAG